MLHVESSVPSQKKTPLPVFDAAEQRALLGKRTVLLAEDEDALRCLMEQTLKVMGYFVIACPDAERAATAFRASHCVDVLVTDFQMPGKSGIELARELTALRPHLPVVLITGTTLPLSAMREIAAQRWVYVSKPCDLSSLRSILERLGGTRVSAA